MIKKALSFIILCSILLYGIFKPVLQRLFANLFRNWENYQAYTDRLNDFSQTPKYNEDLMGWIIYYPTYFLLHILFILVLFKHQPKTRNWVALGLTSFIGFLLVCMITGKLISSNNLFHIPYNIFQSLFGLPFILLAIEGGRILWSDLNKLTNEND